MAEIVALIAKLEALDGPSNLIDHELFATIGGAPHTTKAGNRTIPLRLKGDPTAPAYTASIDAAVALGERQLPGHLWHLMPAAITLAEGRAAAIPRCYVLALLRAMEGDKP